MLKKEKTRSISWYKQRADALFSRFIRNRDSKCITCGATENLQAGHYISRGITELRYAENNVHSQCIRCNIFLKGNYTIYAIKMLEKYGENILYDLDEIVKVYKRAKKKYGVDYYKSIIEKYE